MTTSYETIAGTEPDPDQEHQPRTIKRRNGDLLQMMSEIDDSVFVAWTKCQACGKLAGDCKCPSGPTEPPYVIKWREERFEKSLRRRKHQLSKKAVLGDADRALTYGDLAVIAMSRLGLPYDEAVAQELAEALATADIKSARANLKHGVEEQREARSDERQKVDAGLDAAIDAVTEAQEG